MPICDECCDRHHLPKACIKCRAPCEVCDKLANCNDVTLALLVKSSRRVRAPASA